MKICNYKLYPNDLLNLIGLGHFKNAPFFSKVAGFRFIMVYYRLRIIEFGGKSFAAKSTKEKSH
jgi:hypothetical protein